MSHYIARVVIHEVIKGRERNVHIEHKVFKCVGVDPEDMESAIRCASSNVLEMESRDWSCLVCGEPDAYESFVVTDELWASTGFQPHDGVTHFACFEGLIDRRIRLSDLKTIGQKDVTLNRVVIHMLGGQFDQMSGR